MRWILILLILFWETVGYAACPVADQKARNSNLSDALSLYINCALQNNDDDSQLYLARIYTNGQDSVQKNLQRALLFYHLSSENGNASAMVELANLLTSLDDKEESRQIIRTYAEKMAAQSGWTSKDSSQGQLLHPYVLLLLASEKPESKWFYTSQVKSDPRATQILKNYQIEPEKKNVLMRMATQWKQRKMLDIAYTVLSIQELNKFYETLYPAKGLPNNFARAEAVRLLRERVESRKK